MNDQPQQPTPTKTIPINKWTIGGAVIVAIALVCMGTFSAGGDTPKTETKTVTKTVENTDQIDDLEQEISDLEDKVETCQTSVQYSTQAFIDTLRATMELADAASTFDFDKVQTSTDILNSIDSQTVGTQARECDPEIQDKITGLDAFE
jgi:molecular chaperone GrpE (heat shock protein)